MTAEYTKHVGLRLSKDDDVFNHVTHLRENWERLDKTFEFDFTKSTPVFHTILNLAETSVLQCYVINESNDEIFASQVSNTSVAGEAESFTLTRMNKYGTMLDSMIVKFGGHGTVFGLEVENDIPYIWSNWDVVGAGNKVIGNELVRFPYQAGITLTLSDPSVEIHTSEEEYVTPTVDQQNGLLALRTNYSNSNQVIRLYDLEEFKSGIRNVLGTIQIPSDITYMQGMCVDGYDFYWRTGDTNAVQYPDKVTKFSFLDGQIKAQITCDFGASPDGTFERDFREPESIYLYKDPQSGKKSLFVGLVTGESGLRNIKSYAFHQSGNGERFANEIITNAQLYPFTQNNGKGMRIDRSIGELAKLSPGHYYLSTYDSTLVTDHPLPNVAGFWLFVSPYDTSTGRYQIMIRNTTALDNARIYYRSIASDGNVSPWVLTYTGKSEVILPSLLNGFRNYYANDSHGVGVYKNTSRTASVRGIVAHDSGATDTMIFTLPDECRPVVRQIFTVPTNAGIAQIRVDPDGTVVMDKVIVGTSYTYAFLNFTIALD